MQSKVKLHGGGYSNYSSVLFLKTCKKKRKKNTLRNRRENYN